MDQSEILKDLHNQTRVAVAHYWRTRTAQREKQEANGKADQGLRGSDGQCPRSLDCL